MSCSLSGSCDGRHVDCVVHKKKAPRANPIDASHFSPGWTRTNDLMVNSHPLYRLSYRGKQFSFHNLDNWSQGVKYRTRMCR